MKRENRRSESGLCGSLKSGYAAWCFCKRRHRGSWVFMPDDIDAFLRSEQSSMALIGGPVMNVVLETVRRRPN